MAIVSRTNNISVMYIRNFLAMYDNLDAECLDVGTLCTKANNQWSKYKPVRFLSALTDGSPDWYKSRDGNCGINVPVYPNISTMFSALRANTTMWNYLKPRGGDYGEFYRLLDFMQYDTEAQPPIMPSDLNQKYFAAIGTMPVAADLNFPSSTELALSDISGAINLANCYFGIAICKQGTTGYKYMTESTQIGTGGDGGITVPITSELGTYEVVFMLVENQKLTFESPDITNRFVPLYMGYKTTIIEYSPIFVSVTATWVPNTTSWEVSITNNGDVQITLTGCSLKIRYGDTAPDSDLEIGEASFTIPIGSDGTITVLPNSTQTITGTRLNSLPEFNTRDGLLYFRNNNSAYNATGNFEM